MDIKFTGQNLEVTPAIRDYASKKLSRLISHGAHITSVQISFHVEHNDQIAKATVCVPGHDVFAQQKSSDLYKSIDLLVDKLLIQLEKHS